MRTLTDSRVARRPLAVALTGGSRRATIASLVLLQSLAFPATARAVTKSPPITISRTDPDPATSCLMDTEAVAPMIGVGTNPRHFLAYSGSGFNRSVFYPAWGWKTWYPATMLVPIHASVGGYLAGDAWAASSANLQFASFIGATGCVAVAASTQYDLANNIWTHPASCILAPSDVDGPAIAADPYGYSSNLYAVWLNFTPVSFRVASMPACTRGPIGCCAYGACEASSCPGEAGCPVTYSGGLTVAPSSTVSTHPTAAVSPCTGNVAIVYWSNNNGSGNLYLNVKTPSGTNRYNGSILSGLSHTINSGCTSGGDFRRCQGGTGCGGTGTCSRTAIKPKIIIDREGASCRAYVTYDASVAIGGSPWFRSYLLIYDFGTTTSPKEGGSTPNPTFLKWWVSAPETNGQFNHYQPAISASSVNSNLGWFFYEDSAGACNVNYTGYVSADPLSSMSGIGTLNDVSFPQLAGTPSSLTDYTVGTVSRDYWLYATWVQSVPTSAGCISCAGANYSTVIKHARVAP